MASEGHATAESEPTGEPGSLSVGLTSACNLRCSYCYQRRGRAARVL